MDHRTRPVAISEDLDLSGIDRTLGGSVRSLPPERPVSGSRATSGLFSPFPFLSRFGGLFIRAFEFFFLDLTSAAVTHAQVAAVARAAALLRRRLLAPHLTPAPSCPCLAAPPQPPRARSRASRPGLARLRAPRQLISEHRAPPRLLSTSPASSRPSSAGQSLPRLPVFAKCSCPFSPIDWYGKFCVSILISNCDLDQILNALIPHCIQGI